MPAISFQLALTTVPRRHSLQDVVEDIYFITFILFLGTLLQKLTLIKCLLVLCLKIFSSNKRE